MAAEAKLVPLPGLIIHEDGAATRAPMGVPHYEDVPADPSNDVVASIDAVLVEDEESKLRARIYVPKVEHGVLPLVVYFHGGGFVLCSARSLAYHAFCESFASKTNAIVVSVDYRLAPEHKLPAAYEDASRALHYLDAIARGDASTPKWLKRADFSKVFLLGDSAGANIAYRAALAWCCSSPAPSHELKIVGQVLLQPFFGGEARSRSEERFPDDEIIPLEVCDAFWTHALPVAASRDHPFANPKAAALEYGGGGGLPKMLVIVGGKDPLRDRGIEFANAVKDAKGGDDLVQLMEYEDAQHSFYTIPEAKERALLLEELATWVSSF